MCYVYRTKGDLFRSGILGLYSYIYTPCLLFVYEWLSAKKSTAGYHNG